MNAAADRCKRFVEFQPYLEQDFLNRKMLHLEVRPETVLKVFVFEVDVLFRTVISLLSCDKPSESVIKLIPSH